jgi:hypothetical protein
MPRACIFCGATPLSKEHIWPEWLLRLLPTPEGVETTAQRGSAEPVQVWRSSRPEQTAKFVCAPCNNGWMSQIENAMKPVASEIALGSPVSLNAAAQKIIAIWAVKSAMVYEALRPNADWFYTPAERSSFRLQRIFPDRTYVWIAPVVSPAGFFCFANDMSETLERSPSDTQGYVTTIGFGALALQILGVRLGPNVHHGVSLTLNVEPAPWDATTIPVYPSRGDPVTWPTPMALQGEPGISLFADRWKNQSGANRLTIG